MNYAIIRKDNNKLNLIHPFSIEKINIGEYNIYFLSAKYRFLLKLFVFILKPVQTVSEKNSENLKIIDFFVKRYARITVCASEEKTLSILKRYAEYDIDFFIPEDNQYIVSKALELFGITVFVSTVATELILYFDGNIPKKFREVFVVDFSDRYVHNRINTECIKNISFKTYNSLCEIIGEIPITDIDSIPREIHFTRY